MPMIRVLENSVSPKISLLGLWMVTFLVYLHMTFPLCVCERVGGLSSVSSTFYKDMNAIELGSHPYNLI